MHRINKSYLGLGSNMGDKKLHLANAIKIIKETIGDISRQSSIIETKAWGNTEQENFYNQVVLVNTSLSAIELLDGIAKIEKELGRKKTIHWGPRVIDIDILFYNDEVIDTKVLKVPHPYIQEREFVLQSLVEIAPTFKHPILKKTNMQLLEELTSKQ
jgi:2-amino-4-hydroxy-6-hydroxymethyldihydropteridine diphosphokinase